MSRRRPPPHGTRSRYARGCRCPGCTEGSRIYHKRLRENRSTSAYVSPVGTQRRLWALARIGWSWPALAERLGVTDRWPSLLANQWTPTVSRETERRVRELYDLLSLTPGPSPRAAGWAARRGWVPPLAWDDDTIDDPDAQPWGGSAEEAAPVVDEVAIRRALAGERIRLTRLERHHAVHHGVPRYGVNAVAAALHMSGSTVGDLYRRPLPASTEESAA